MKSIARRIAYNTSTARADDFSSRAYTHTRAMTNMSTEFAFPSPFRAKPFEQRRSIATKVRMDYQQKKVPCIVEVAKQTPGNTLTGLPRSKYLVSANAPASSLKDAILSDAGLAADAPLQLFYAQSGAELPLSLIHI